MDDVIFIKLMMLIVTIGIIILLTCQYFNQNSNQYFSQNLKYEGLQKDNNGCPVCPVCPICPICPEKESTDGKNIVIDVNRSGGTPIGNPVREYDYRALSDPLVPPYKRDDYQIPLPAIPTRGYPSSFKKLGLLMDDSATNTDPYKFMLLMGRQKYPGSNFYDYYVTENKPDSALKFDLPDLHKELNTDDTLTIKEVGKTYAVKIDRNLGFDYHPFIY